MTRIDSLSKLACFILLSAVGLSNFFCTNIWFAPLQEILSGEVLLLLLMELVIGPLLPFNPFLRDRVAKAIILQKVSL